MRTRALLSLLTMQPPSPPSASTALAAPLRRIGDPGKLSRVVGIVGNVPADDSPSRGGHVECQGHLCTFTQKSNQSIIAGDVSDLRNGFLVSVPPSRHFFFGRIQKITYEPNPPFSPPSGHGCKIYGINPIPPSPATTSRPPTYVQKSPVSSHPTTSPLPTPTTTHPTISPQQATPTPANAPPRTRSPSTQKATATPSVVSATTPAADYQSAFLLVASSE